MKGAGVRGRLMGGHRIAISGELGLDNCGGEDFGEVGDVGVKVVGVATDLLPLSGKGIRNRAFGGYPKYL